ncbi:MAG: MotA/TolQ/ExbB proton channel family protein [Rhodocyclaceae bacterium]|nr:MotA/TolQ/ExbB proton channel family protein [Rhodocyclaceae bacterium]
MDATPTPTSGAFDIAHMWAQGDTVSHAVALALLLMSILSWYLILSRLLRSFEHRREGGATGAFWEATDVAAGIEVLARKAPGGAFHGLASQAHSAAEHYRRHARGSLGGALGLDEFLTRAMRQSIARATADLESGLTVLASIGSTAPFVGLFGTVWGIYHALATIATTGMATLDKVAGPVGEALIMTAAGLFVAIPAVLAYNTLTRDNRLKLAALDGFAHDLHAYYTTGARVTPSRGAAAMPATEAVSGSAA